MGVGGGGNEGELFILPPHGPRIEALDRVVCRMLLVMQDFISPPLV